MVSFCIEDLEPEIKEVEMETLTNSNSSNGIGNGTVKTKAQEAEEVSGEFWGEIGGGGWVLSRKHRDRMVVGAF